MWVTPTSSPQGTQIRSKVGHLNTMSTSQGLRTAFEVNGISIPAVGLGTFQGNDGNGRVKEIVLKALQNGYRHIDTAASYNNEKEVGEAIKESGIRREEIFVTTKLYDSFLSEHHFS